MKFLDEENHKEKEFEKKLTPEQLFKLPLEERLKVKSKVQINGKDRNLHKNEEKRKRDINDNFEMFEEDPIPKMEKKFNKLGFDL